MRWWGSVKSGRSPSRPSRRLHEGHGPRPTNAEHLVSASGKSRQISTGGALGHRPAGHFSHTAGDIQLLPKILDAASRYEKRPHDDAMAAMLDKQYMTTLFRTWSPSHPIVCRQRARRSTSTPDRDGDAAYTPSLTRRRPRWGKRHRLMMPCRPHPHPLPPREGEGTPVLILAPMPSRRRAG